MSINVNEIKERVEVICAKDQKTIYLNDVKFNKYAAMAQDKIIIEQRNAAEGNYLTPDGLSELKATSSHNADPNTGEFTKPSDFMYLTNSWVQNFVKNKNGDMFSMQSSIDVMNDAETVDRRSSQLKRVSESNPIMVEFDTIFKVYPQTIGTVNLTYIREPVTPVWAFTIANNEQVYDSGNSVDFELPYQFKDDLIWNICSLLGVTVRQADLVQAGQALNPRG
jgi:hypothetical protein